MTSCQEAFEGTKHALTSHFVLVMPDYGRPFEVVCDASITGVGGVLLQEGRLVAYESRKLSPAERNHTTGEPEWNLGKHAPEALQDYWDRATALRSGSGTGRAPGLPTLPPATKSKGTPRPLVRPVGRRNCTRMITKANS